MTITVTPLHLVGSDNRGETYDFSIRENSDFILITRKKGALCGNTYHLGKSPKTNPKYFVLLQGKIIFRYRHIDKEQHEEMIIYEPSIIEVPCKITHAIEVLDDMLILECNSIDDIKDDRFREGVILLT